MDLVREEPPEIDDPLLEAVDAFVTDAVEPRVEKMEQTDQLPMEIVEEARDYGVLDMLRDERYGGFDTDFFTYCLALERIASVSCSIAETINHHSLATIGIERHGSEAQKERYLASDTSVGSLMLSEPGAGSSPSDLEAVADETEDGYVISGHKRFCTNGSFSDVCLVVARKRPAPSDSHGVSVFLVPGVEDTEGLTFERMEFMGMRGHITGDAVFEDVTVPESSLLGEVGQGFRIAMGNIDLGRTGLAAMATGVAQSAFDNAVEYASDREQGGSAIGEYQSIQLLLAEMDAKLAAAKHFTAQSAYSIAEDDVDTRLSARSKFYAANAAEYVTRNAMQVYGGRGYSTEYPLERYFRDARGLAILGGTTEIRSC